MNSRNLKISIITENDAIEAKKILFQRYDSEKVKNYRKNVALKLKESLKNDQNF